MVFVKGECLEGKCPRGNDGQSHPDRLGSAPQTRQYIHVQGEGMRIGDGGERKKLSRGKGLAPPT